MKIKQAAEKSGLSTRNIRFYEESGLIGVGREENQRSKKDKRLSLFLPLLRISSSITIHHIYIHSGLISPSAHVHAHEEER